MSRLQEPAELSAKALECLVDDLRLEFRRSARPANVVGLLAAYAGRQVDWRPFAFWADEGYTRNLIVREVRFELILLCWGPGQSSPIHNHEGQDCWMATLDGEIEEVRFPMPARHALDPLVASASKHTRRPDVAYIRDEIGLHLVRNAGGGPAASLHLYAEPYDECSVYDPTSGRVTRKALSFYSIRGVRRDPERRDP